MLRCLRFFRLGHGIGSLSFWLLNYLLYNLVRKSPFVKRISLKWEPGVVRAIFCREQSELTF
ncbi:hypothetical protein LFML04_1408 [Leptospirillum ferriphilum ML-04]|uniref:Uncharacterized protein n=1 Tax=Leptospirillum ferriphilum (strain ML-04) TaxID=1048260 RepID=J9ZBR4_LEPFM|nr:hypothetical protein LFML04_1408 [Leptospirillum ferriphilum ML-04]